MSERPFRLRETIKKHGSSAMADADRERRMQAQNWRVYDSSEGAFSQFFRKVLGGHPDIPTYLNQHYGRRKRLVALELGGPGSQFFGDLDRWARPRTIRSLGATLTDQRSDSQREDDAFIGHEVLEANIFGSHYAHRHTLDEHGEPVYARRNFPGWELIKAWIRKHQKADFVMSRLVGPLASMKAPEDAQFFLVNILRWYKILRKGGTMLLETPSVFNVEAFAAKLTATGLFEVETGRVGSDHGILRVRRLKGSPDAIDEIFRS